MQTPSHNRILSRRTVCAETSLSPSTIYRMMRMGTFPQPIRLSTYRVGWSEAAVRSWINARLAA